VQQVKHNVAVNHNVKRTRCVTAMLFRWSIQTRGSYC